MKSPVIQVVTHPLNRIQTELRLEHEKAQRRYELEKEESELRLTAWKEQYKSNTKNGKAAPARPLDTPEQPKLRRLIVNDATFEALHGTMSENAAGVLVRPSDGKVSELLKLEFQPRLVFRSVPMNGMCFWPSRTRRAPI